MYKYKNTETNDLGLILKLIKSENKEMENYIIKIEKTGNFYYLFPEEV
ncbi:hypothetical protein SDC9_48147 [bioreactor metagenome]|uniref:Uncharacterized protein n=1 Tax=bioreactor metagenome TaxID=1076179 RepID=A0A644WEE6_9ZZZZ